MPTLQEWEAAYHALNKATQALGDLIDARVIAMDEKNRASADAKMKAAIDTMSLELGKCSDALRVLRPPLKP